MSIVPSNVLCPVLVGRASPLAAAREVLARASRGEGRAMLVPGEAGIGKSTFVRAVVDLARSAGFIVLKGACFEADRSLPHAALQDLVHGWLAGTSAAVGRHVLDPALPELVATFPELRARFPDVSPASAVDAEQHRRQLFRAIGEMLHGLARTQPVLLVLEDVHWADDASLDLAVHLTRGASTAAVLLLLTYRADEIGQSLARALAMLDRTRLAVELPLQRLSPREVGAMLRAIFQGEERGSDPFVATLHELTEGNPFFIEETLKALVVSGDLVVLEGGGWRAQAIARLQVPRTAVEAVRRRLSGLSGPARDLASTAAVIGRRFDFALLGALTPHDEHTLITLVKELALAQLVVEESAERFAFRHALTREAIYAELLARERIALHRRVAAAIAEVHRVDLPAHVDALAYHSYEGEEWDAARVHTRAAAEHALALHAPRAALAHLDRALAASAHLGEQPEIDLLLARGRACETLGDFTRAEEAFEQALAAARDTGRGAWEWEALLALGLLWSARDYRRAGAYRRASLELARALQDPTRIARSLDRVGNWHVNLDEPGEGVPHHEEALAIFERLNDRRGVAETVDLLAMAAFVAGDLVTSASHYERSVALFDGLSDRRGLANALGLLPLCGPSFQSACTTPWRSASPDALLENQRALRMARDIGWRVGEAFCLYLLADCHGWRGRYDLALPEGREALAIAEEIEHLQWQCAALTTQGMALLDLAAPDEARLLLERAFGIAERLGSRTWRRWAAAPLATALADAGDTAAADAMVDAGFALHGSASADAAASTPENPASTLAERKLWLARAHVALADGRAADALALVDARLAAESVGARSSASTGASAPPPALAYLRGRALAALGDPAAAEALELAHGAALYDGARPLVWRARAELGAVYLARRQRLAARRAFDEARSVAEELAARVADLELQARFRRMIDTYAPAAPAPSKRKQAAMAFAGLTRREREVATLVAQGKSNRAAGRALGIARADRRGTRRRLAREARLRLAHPARRMGGGARSGQPFPSERSLTPGTAAVLVLLPRARVPSAESSPQSRVPSPES